MMNWWKMLEVGLGDDSWETMVIREAAYVKDF